MVSFLGVDKLLLLVDVRIQVLLLLHLLDLNQIHIVNLVQCLDVLLVLVDYCLPFLGLVLRGLGSFLLRLGSHRRIIQIVVEQLSKIRCSPLVTRH